MEGLSKAYYLKPVKIIRDSVHEYINLTKFDLELIDTIPFQRLSDVRQLTCQHVYPGARHTRFEHSLGVLELMRSSIKYLNRNRYLAEERSSKAALDSADPEEGSGGASKNPYDKPPLIDATLEFNASVAALLHDVGHCPFSHMGETQFDEKSVRSALVEDVEKYAQLNEGSDLIEILKTREKIGAVHERLSCIVILRKYRTILTNLTHLAEGEESCEIEVDFELIIRSILGIEYKVETTGELKANRLKNVIVRLLNSKIFDVDKLDYIMRDSHLTGIGTPSIDTQRLFRNMYLDDENKCNLVFTSKAVPALQNMIDARDGLYLYVYNHHAVVYSDFMNTYISRRLAHNFDAFTKIAPDCAEVSYSSGQQSLFPLGLVPKSYLFSVKAVAEENHSDSAWLSLLNSIYIKSNDLLNHTRREGQDREVFDEDSNIQQTALTGALRTELGLYWNNEAVSDTNKDDMARRIYNSMRLTHQYMKRHYLKPWWKTVFEFTNFMNHHFQDDRVREQAGKFICDGGDYGLEADEMRSQIAKHIVHITQQLKKDEKDENLDLGLIEALYDGDFFVIQRPTNFFSPDTIKGLEIALRNNEILGAPLGVNRQMNGYYLKTLTNIIPQKDYSSIYAKEGFYVFSKQPHIELGNGDDAGQRRLQKHYELLEEIFVFVVKRLINGGEQEFVEKFQNGTSQGEEESKDRIYNEFKKIKKPD